MGYEFWVGIAFLMWCVGLVIFFISINSQYERNLNKVGLRLSWLSLTPKEISPADQARGVLGKIFKFLLVFGFGLASILLGPIL